ncbi:hypothetical protein Golob_027276 [Gossypium lobatum]|uniref:Uncharacterized protein n=1 Tax=Gossypium lobatum TaxID=34289 RepID=A0A7J8NF20_9ROSI|nr:hypothetical protein [Gossypium lobatum]
MARQFGNFIGLFLDYDMKAIGSGYQGFLRIRVCLNLGHSKSFFPIRILHGRKELSPEWDLPIWASPRLVGIGTSCWLWEEGPAFKTGDTLKSVYSGSSITQANIQCSFQHEFWNIDWLWRVEQPDAMKLLNWNVRGLGNPLAVSSSSLRGGLALYWKDTCQIRLCSFSSVDIDMLLEDDLLCSFSSVDIDMLLEDDFEGNTWRFTGFYGLPVESRRRQLWDLLR